MLYLSGQEMEGEIYKLYEFFRSPTCSLLLFSFNIYMAAQCVKGTCTCCVGCIAACGDCKFCTKRSEKYVLP